VKVQIGSGRARLPGFINVDIRPLAETDIVGHAGNLGTLADGSVEILFSNALLEHVFLGHQGSVLEEWKRVLAAESLLVCLGVPDFETIARLYLDRARGVIGERFDLYNVYRYTHGEPEHATDVDWATWQPDRYPDQAPPGWLPQLHKGLFDAAYLGSLFEVAGLPAKLFRYAYPGEEHTLNLGVVVDRSEGRADSRDRDSIVSGLRRIPEVGRYVDLDSIIAAESARVPRDSLLEYQPRPTSLAPPRSFASRVWRRLERVARPMRL
jgi:hypothetical protein